MFDYKDVLKHRPPTGEVQHGEVERIPEELTSLRQGPLGIVYQNPYITIVREAVKFPSLSVGTHIRVMEGPPDLDVFGVVILPIRPRPNGQEPEIALVKQFRYPMRGWMSEIPRGGVGTHERNATGAVRELREETGLPSPDLMVRMDDLANNSGISDTVCRYYLAVYMGPTETGRRMGDSKEAISGITWVPLSEWREEAMRPPVPGRPIGGLDIFTNAAFGLAYLSGTMSKMEVACNRVFGQRAHDSSRYGPELRDLIEAGDSHFDIRVTLRDEEAAKQMRDELPLMDLKMEGQKGTVLTCFDVPLLSVVWLSQRSGVLRIDLVE